MSSIVNGNSEPEVSSVAPREWASPARKALWLCWISCCPGMVRHLLPLLLCLLQLIFAILDARHPEAVGAEFHHLVSRGGGWQASLSLGGAVRSGRTSCGVGSKFRYRGHEKLLGITRRRDGLLEGESREAVIAGGISAFG
jgi:hypothetical protein